MFGGVQRIVQSSSSGLAGLAEIVAFARQHPEAYAVDYWNAVSPNEVPMQVISGWAVEGFEKLEAGADWSLIMLDCGDAPDSFRLSECRFAPDMMPDRFRAFATADTVRSGKEFPGAQSVTELSKHHVDELNHSLLNWRQSAQGYDGSNGYLLWLGAASLALCDSVRDPVLCQRILRGRSAMVLMSGFEEIFFYSGTISSAGLSHT